MFLIISNQLLKMFLMLIVGFLCIKLGILDHNGTKGFSNFLLMIVNPLLMVNALQTDYSPELNTGILFASLLALITHILGIVLAHLLIHSKEESQAAIEKFGCVYSNCGFMGIPLAQSMFGSTGVIYITMYSLVFAVFAWTHGLILMTGNTSWKQLRKGLTSPAVIGTVLGIIFYFIQFRLPGALGASVDYIASMNTPMAMIVAGAALAESDILQALKQTGVYKVAFIKLILLPALILAVIAVLPIPKEPATVILTAAACPVATTGTLFALRYNKNYEYSSAIFSLTTILSLVTIPMIILAGESLKII